MTDATPVRRLRSQRSMPVRATGVQPAAPTATASMPVIVRFVDKGPHGTGTTSAIRAGVVASVAWLSALGAQAPAIGQAGWAAGHAAGETALSTRVSTAAARNRGDDTIRITLWYPAVAGAVERTVTIGDDARPVFVAGRVATDARWADGARRPLLLMSHGFGGVARQMTWLGTALARAGYVVAAVDHPGTNGRDGVTPEGAYAPWERAADLSAALDRVLADDALAQRIDRRRVGVVGFSIGGWTAALLAGARTDFAAFDRFCVSPARDSICDPQREFPLDFSKRHGVLKQPGMEDLAWGERASRRDPRIRAAFLIAPALAQATDAASLATIGIPVFVLVGAADTVTRPATNAEVFARAMPGATLVTLPGVGHYDFLSECGPEGRRVAAPYCSDGEGTPRTQTHATTVAHVVRFFDSHLR